MSHSCQVFKSQRSGEAVFGAEFRLPVLRKKEMKCTTGHRGKFQGERSQVLGSRPLSWYLFCLLSLLSPYGSILDTQYTAVYPRVVKGRVGIVTEGYSTRCSCVIQTSCYPKQRTLSWLLCSCPSGPLCQQQDSIFSL